MLDDLGVKAWGQDSVFSEEHSEARDVSCVDSYKNGDVGNKFCAIKP